MRERVNAGQCEGKIRYASMKAAKGALRHHTGSAATNHAYSCSNCFGFHIGHKAERRRA